MLTRFVKFPVYTIFINLYTHYQRYTGRISLQENQSQCENANKLCDEYERREMQKEKENIAKKIEYRDYLLKQMHDKEKKSSLEEMPAMTRFSGESLNANE